MIRSSTVRFLALAVGLIAPLTAPAVSYAHGHAHSEAAEHAAHHAADTATLTDHPTVRAHEHDEDHGHPRLDPSAFTRVLKDLPAIRKEAVTIAVADVVFRETTDAPDPNESPPDRHGTSPPQARAPPVL